MNVLKLMILGLIVFLAGCESVKLNTLEKLGYEKREILTSRVEKAKDAQEDAKKQFESALAEFQSVVKFDGGELGSIYDRLHNEYELSKKQADEVSERINSVEFVAKKLFDEWKQELAQYSNSDLQRKSQAQLNKTQQQYSTLIKTMRKVEKKIAPVLAVFHDQILYLKHNLNAQAISSLKGEIGNIKSDVSKLVQQMNRSIYESNQFIKQMEN